MVTVVSHFAGIVLPFFLGYSSVVVLGMAMGVSQLGAALWLAIKGFAAPRALEPV